MLHSGTDTRYPEYMRYSVIQNPHWHELLAVVLAKAVARINRLAARTFLMPMT